jgi:hypothetical protein
MLGRWVKVRITETPREVELDGVSLDGLIQGMVRDVSPLMGAWLVTEGYAVPEMRQTREDRREITRGGQRRQSRRQTERRAVPD